MEIRKPSPEEDKEIVEVCNLIWKFIIDEKHYEPSILYNATAVMTAAGIKQLPRQGKFAMIRNICKGAEIPVVEEVAGEVKPSIPGKN